MDDNAVMLLKKNEYVSEILYLTRDKFESGLQKMYDDTKKINRSHRFILRDFQNYLASIPSWTQDKKNEVCEPFYEIDQLDQLLKNVRHVMLSIFAPVTETNSELTLESFVYKTYLTIARELWKKPYLLYDRIDNTDDKKLYQIKLDEIVSESIQTTLRHIVPLEKIDEHRNVEEHEVPVQSVAEIQYNHDLDDVEIVSQTPDCASDRDSRSRSVSRCTSRSNSKSRSASTCSKSDLASESDSDSELESTSDSDTKSVQSSSSKASTNTIKSTNDPVKKIIVVESEHREEENKEKRASNKNQTTSLDKYNMYSSKGLIGYLINKRKLKKDKSNIF